MTTSCTVITAFIHKDLLRTEATDKPNNDLVRFVSMIWFLRAFATPVDAKQKHDDAHNQKDSRASNNNNPEDAYLGVFVIGVRILGENKGFHLGRSAHDESLLSAWACTSYETRHKRTRPLLRQTNARDPDVDEYMHDMLYPAVKDNASGTPRHYAELRSVAESCRAGEGSGGYPFSCDTKSPSPP